MSFFKGEFHHLYMFKVLLEFTAQVEHVVLSEGKSQPQNHSGLFLCD